MSRRNGIFTQMQIAAIFLIVASMGCSDSSSNNWNNMFSRGDDRRVEPRGNDAPPANRPEPGATAAKPETARNDYVQPEPQSRTAAPERGSPSAIEQYAANMNPPSRSGPRIQSNPSTPSSSAPGNASPTFGTANTSERRSSGASMGESSPVRVASDRPVGSDVNQPASASMSRQPAPNNAMFIDSTNQPAAANQGGSSLPTVEDRSARPVAAQPPKTISPPSADADSSGVPVIHNVTATPAENTSPESDGSSRIADIRRNEGNSVTPPRDDAAERRRREIAQQEAKVAADPTNVEEQFNLRTMYLSDGRDSDALQPIRGVTPDVEEIMLAQLRSLQAARSGSARDSATWANRQLEATRALQEKLRAKADLQVPKVELCREIRQFGVYTPFPSSDFKAGIPNDVLIYVEVDNFESRKLAGDEYRTLLGAQLSLLSKDGKVLVSLDEPNIEDVSRGVRRDFFLAFGPITIPGNLPVGEYVVDVSIEDKLAGKTNNNKTSLRLVP